MNNSSLSPLHKLHRHFYIAFFVLVIGLVVSLSSTCAVAEVYEEVYLTLSRKTGPQLYNIALDRIGIYVDKTVATEDVASLSDEFDRDNVQSYGGGFHIVKLRGPVDRKSLNGQVRTLSKHKLVKMAGAVLYRHGYDTPMLLTDMIIVVFRKSLSEPEIKEFAKAKGLVAIKNNSLVTRQWLFRLGPNAKGDALDIVQIILDGQNDIVEFALPNFAFKLIPLQSVPNDSLFNDQWHHRNLGQGNGTFDADVDSEMAWSLSRGHKDTIIALFDTGFSLNHPDLSSNFWRNLGEEGPDANGTLKENNNCDDDGNGYDDDLHGYDFSVCFLGTCPTNNHTNCSDTSNDWGAITAAEHGTSVAGVAAGEGNNGSGISGICPNCSLMLLQIDFDLATEWSIEEAITYAGDRNADILNNSWSYQPGDVVPETVINVIDAIAAKGTIIFWAMDNKNSNDCAGSSWEIFTNQNVIPVSAASNWDRKVTESGIGDCLGILAPSFGGYGPIMENSVQVGEDYSGSLNMVTTDLLSNAGYNDTHIPADSPDHHSSYCDEGADTADKNYTLCFSGTSAATPVAAGVGGLVLSVKPDIGTQAMERLLQDTADKIEPSLANYGANTGRSNSDTTATPTHGYGRVNAFEAVKVIAPFTHNGQDLPGGTDIFIRDNKLDWGNTAQQVPNAPSWRAGSNVLMERVRGNIPHYQSIDIKVDAPPYQTAPATSVLFDSFTHENPVSGELNKVYVRVHNRGPKPATNVRVKLHWSMAGTALPQLPSDFWSAWPADSSDQAIWHSLGSREISMVGYSGASVASTSADGSEIVSFDFTGPPLDPTLQAFRHHCLFAVIDSPDDPVRETRLVPDQVTPTNNNVTHRNLAVQDAATGGSSFGLMVRNPFSKAITTRLKLIKPKRWGVSLSKFGDGEPFELGAGEEVPVIVKIIPGEKGIAGDVEIRQEIVFKEDFQAFGGFVYRFTGK